MLWLGSLAADIIGSVALSTNDQLSNIDVAVAIIVCYFATLQDQFDTKQVCSWSWNARSGFFIIQFLTRHVSFSLMTKSQAQV